MLLGMYAIQASSSRHIVFNCRLYQIFERARTGHSPESHIIAASSTGRMQNHMVTPIYITDVCYFTKGHTVFLTKDHIPGEHYINAPPAGNCPTHLIPDDTIGRLPFEVTIRSMMQKSFMLEFRGKKYSLPYEKTLYIDTPKMLSRSSATSPIFNIYVFR